MTAGERIKKTEAFFRICGRGLCAFSKTKWISAHTSSEKIRTAYSSQSNQLPVTSDQLLVNQFTSSNQKIFRAREIARWLSLIPSVRLIAIGNSVAFRTASPHSDIDLLIITAPKTIWITRAIIITILALLGLRPKPNRERDTICASFFITTEAIQLSKIALANDDPYLDHWLRSLIPLVDRHHTWRDFLCTNNLPSSMPSSWFLTHRKYTNTIRFAEKILTLFNTITKKIQQHIFPKNIRNAPPEQTGVVINDTMLKFHTQDRRTWYREEVEKLLL